MFDDQGHLQLPAFQFRRVVSAFIFRSWHAVLSRWERDLADLKRDLERRTLPEPEEVMSSSDT